MTDERHSKFGGNPDRNQNGRRPSSLNNRRQPEGRGDPRFRTGDSRKAIEILDELVEAEPNNLEYRFVRANCFCSLAAATLKFDPDKSLQYRDRAIEEFESLILKDQENHEYQYRLAVACSLGDKKNSSAHEKKLIKRSVEIADELAERFPLFLDYHFLMISTRVRLADQQMKNGNLKVAFESLQLCMPSLERIKRLSHPRFGRTNKASINRLMDQLRKLAREAEKSGDTKLAQEINVALGQIRVRNDGKPIQR
jgi:tetratricopeptide (TPR) repeat protein